MLGVTNRAGVEDTRLEAKDTKKIRGQGQPFRGQTFSRPRTRMLEAMAKNQGYRRKCSPKTNKNSSKFFFRQSQKKRKRSSKNCFRRPPFEGNEKGLHKFFARFLAFSNKISTAQRAEDMAIFEDLRLRGQGQGLQNVSSRTFSRTRASSRTPLLVTKVLCLGASF